MLCAIAPSTALAFRAEDGGFPRIRSEAAASRQAQAAPRVLSAAQAEAATAIEREGMKVVWDQRLATPMVVRGTDLGAPSAARRQGRAMAAAGGDQAEDTSALAVLDNLALLFGIQDAAAEFKVKKETVDGKGFRHVRVSQWHNGLRVVGGSLIVHFNNAGVAYEVNGKYIPDIEVTDRAKITEAEAVRLAKASLAARDVTAGDTEAPPEQVVFAKNMESRRAYELALVRRAGDQIISRWRVWVDALDGAVLLAYNDIKQIGAPTGNGAPALLSGTRLSAEGGGTATVTGWEEHVTPPVFYMHDPELKWQLLNGAITSGYPDSSTYAHRFTSDWGTSDPAEVSGAVNFAISQEYFRNVHGRDSYNGEGILARAYVHHPENDGSPMNNAYWNGIAIYIGDGDGQSMSSLVVLDVFAHEYTHAVTEYTADLRYEDESGALNESFSDIFGVCAEFYAQPDGRSSYPNALPGHADWLIGEDCMVGVTAMRDMRDPKNWRTVGFGGAQPSLYKGSYWYEGLLDSGGVHQNSGVQNYFFYLLCEGGSGTNDTSAYGFNVTGIGIENAEQIAYRALAVYCTEDTDYFAAKEAWISAARDLDPTWVRSVKHAWNAVLGLAPPPPMAINTVSELPGGWVGTPYTLSFYAVNGIPAYTWELAGGDPLPQGLSLSTDGRLTGVPLEEGTRVFRVIATDQVGEAATNQFTLVIASRMEIPYEQNFDAKAGMPDAWFQEFEVNNVSWVFRSGSGTTPANPSQAYSAPNNARLGVDKDALIGSTTRLVTPMIDFGEAPYAAVLTFRHYMAQWVSSRDRLRVYYRTAPNAEWVLLEEYAANVSTWTQRNITLPETSRTFYIAFEGVANYGYGIHIDDVWIGDPTPELHIQSPGELEEAVIDHSYSNSLTAVGGIPPYTFSIVQGSLPPGLSLSEDGVISGTGTVAVEDAPFTVQVTDSVGATNTLDLLLTVAPPRAVLFYEDFESAGLTKQQWTQQQITNTLTWVVQGGGGNANSILLPRYAHGGNFNATLYWWNIGQERTDHVTRLISPEINLGLTPVAPRLTFWHCMAELQDDQDHLRVYARSSASAEWVLLATYTNDVPMWTKRTLILPNPTSTYYLAFEGNARYGAGVCLDDIRITENAPAPVFITPSPLADGTIWLDYQAKLIASGGIEPYVFALTSYGSLPEGVTLASDGTLSGIPGEAGVFQFEVYVTGADGLATTNQYQLRIVGGHALPLTEDFESGAALPDGWTLEDAGAFDWTFQNGSPSRYPSSAHSGTINACFYYNKPGVVRRKLVMPMLNTLKGIENPRLSFWFYMKDWDGDLDILKVYYKTSPTNTTWTLLETFKTSVSSWTQVTIALQDPSESYMIAFEGESHWGHGICIDDVEVTGEAVSTGSDYETWKKEQFQEDADNPDIAGDYADPDGDGVPNIWEYIHGTNPKDETEGPGAVLHISIVDGKPVLFFQIGKDAIAVGVTWWIETCTDLLVQDWEDVNGTESPTSQDFWWEIMYETGLSVADSPQRFFRLKAIVP